MFNQLLLVNDDLAVAGRFRGLARSGQSVSTLELATLMSFGALAAISSAIIETPWKFPGQSILQSIIPMALGVALVPRRTSGSVMGIGSVVSVGCMRLFGFTGLGTGALTSLFLTGPMLDLALRRARGGWQVYARLILAGPATNIAALLIRLATKLLTGDLSGRHVANWLPEAIWTYPLCGVVAGLIAALAWFQWASRDKAAPREATA